MEIAILLLVIVPLTSASPLRPSHRTQPESFPSQSGVQAFEVTGSRATQDSHVPGLRITPFHSGDKHQNIMDALRSSIAVPVPRPKRSPPRGCQLGTCQLHNLANTLYQIGKTSGKEDSKNAHDPQGYGR